ncbi:hypothetical protein F4777DRAFT_502601 [Nemania sp. FL0916]|nr:hypothetical protein F4777DRAFT_502601 [Nemania sp. FL0916]
MAGDLDVDWSLLQQIPALPPPTGVQSDFENPKSRAALAEIVVGLTYALMLVFLALRLYTRITITRSLGADDYFTLAAGASITAFTGVSLSLFGRPLGPHQWDVPLSKFNASFLERTLTSIVLFSLSSLLVKVALLALYLRVFSPNATARLMIWVGVATIVAFYILAIIINIVFCVPISMTTPVPDKDAWAKKLEASSCSQAVYNLNAAIGLFGVVSDIYVLVIPIRMVCKLRIRRARKFGILGIFLTGLLYEHSNHQHAVCQLTLLRATALSIASTAFRFIQLESFDFTWDSIPSYSLRAAELNIGLICGCMPVIFVVLKRFFHHGSTKEQLSSSPAMRTPSHAYIADLHRTGTEQSWNMTEEYLPRPTPAVVRPQRSPATREERSTFDELGSVESNHGHFRNPG